MRDSQSHSLYIQTKGHAQTLNIVVLEGFDGKKNKIKFSQEKIKTTLSCLYSTREVMLSHILTGQFMYQSAQLTFTNLN